MAEYIDESLLDPRLRSNASSGGAQTRTSTPLGSQSVTDANAGRGFVPPNAPPPSVNLDEYYPDESVLILPPSSAQAFDFCLDSNDIQHSDERFWIMGLQAGIGIGIYGAREAILNEMQNGNTVFGQWVQSSPNPVKRRYSIGLACEQGFDRRVAWRVAMNYSIHCQQFIDWVVKNGRVDLLPETGNHLFGTGIFFDNDRAALCHANAHHRALINMLSNPEAGNNTDDGQTAPPAPTTESFLSGGRFVAGVDMARLDPTISSTVRAVKAAYNIAPANSEPVQYMATPAGDAQEEATPQGIFSLGGYHETTQQGTFHLGDHRETMQQRIFPFGDSPEVMQHEIVPSGYVGSFGGPENHGQNTEVRPE